MADYTYDTGTDKDVDPQGVAEFFACAEAGKHTGVVTTLALYPNAVNWRRHTVGDAESDTDALFIACDKHQTHIAEILLDAKAPIESRNWGSNKATPLIMAICSQNIETVELLLARGANPATPDAEGNAPLSFACDLSQVQIAHALLKMGMDPDIRNARGLPMLALAARGGSKEMVKLLIEYNASPADKEVLAEANKFMRGEMAAFVKQAFWDHDQSLRKAFNTEVETTMTGGTASALPVRKPLKLKAVQ